MAFLMEFPQVFTVEASLYCNSMIGVFHGIDWAPLIWCFPHYISMMAVSKFFFVEYPPHNNSSIKMVAKRELVRTGLSADAVLLPVWGSGNIKIQRCKQYLCDEPNMQVEAVFLYCSPDCPSCPANAIQMGQATWAIWAATKKYSLKYFHAATCWQTCQTENHLSESLSQASESELTKYNLLGGQLWDFMCLSA